MRTKQDPVDAMAVGLSQGGAKEWQKQIPSMRVPLPHSLSHARGLC